MKVYIIIAMFVSGVECSGPPAPHHSDGYRGREDRVWQSRLHSQGRHCHFALGHSHITHIVLCFMPPPWNVSRHLVFLQSVQNCCECNSFYTAGGNLIKLYHSASLNALLCIKAEIRCNMFRSKVLALVLRLLVGAFVTFSFCDKL